MAFVDPAMPGGEPATTTTRSPSWARPLSSSSWSTWSTIVVGVVDLRGQEGLDSPGDRELALHLLDWREGDQRDLGAVAGEQAARSTPSA